MLQLSQPRKVLLAEDDPISAQIVCLTLKRAGYTVRWVKDGLEALTALRSEAYDAVLSDWMMPCMDGIELLRRIRERFAAPACPITLILTALASNEAREHALRSGADAYLAKPYSTKELTTTLEQLFERRQQVVPNLAAPRLPRPTQVPPPFVAVTIVGNSGCPERIETIFKKMPKDIAAAFFLFLEGSEWLQNTLSSVVKRDCGFKINRAAKGLPIRPAEIYLFHPDAPLALTPSPLGLVERAADPLRGPEWNADQLMQSVADVFGSGAIGVVLSGLGCRGAAGAKYLCQSGGLVLIEDPQTATAPMLPQATLDLGLPHQRTATSQLPWSLPLAIRMQLERALQAAG